MSISHNYYEDVFRSPNNSSTAKMLYSFPKADRFARKKKILCDKVYNLPSMKSKRAPSLGYGTKYDFTKTWANTPAPCNYRIKSIFEVNKDKKIGCAFGTGREEMQCTGPLAKIKTNDNPGPGTYPHKTTLSKSTFSFGGGHTVEENKQQRMVPGPGNYQTPFPLNKTGEYFLSKFKSSRSASFSADHGDRFPMKIENTPGPGTYRIQLKPGGPDFVSKFRSSMPQSFTHSPRKESATLTPKLTPGPGYYDLPTEFGTTIKTDQDNNKENDPNKNEMSKNNKITGVSYS